MKSEPLRLEFLVKERVSETRAIGKFDVKPGDPAMVASFGLRAFRSKFQNRRSHARAGHLTVQPQISMSLMYSRLFPSPNPQLRTYDLPLLPCGLIVTTTTP